MDQAKVASIRLEETGLDIKQLKLTVDSQSKVTLTLNHQLKATGKMAWIFNCSIARTSCRLRRSSLNHKNRCSLSLIAKCSKTESIKQLVVSLITEKKRHIETRRPKDEFSFSAHNTRRTLSDRLKTANVKHD